MYKFASEGPPWVAEFDYGQNKYQRSSAYGSADQSTTLGNVVPSGVPIPEGLGLEDGGIRVGLNNSPRRPIGNWMYGTDNMQPMDSGGPNLFPSKNPMVPLVSNESMPPPSAMPQNANVYPPMYNPHTGLRIDPQSGGMLMDDGVYRPKVHTLHDKHFNRNTSTGVSMFSGLPHYLRNPSNYYGAPKSKKKKKEEPKKSGWGSEDTQAVTNFASQVAQTWVHGQTQRDIEEMRLKSQQKLLEQQTALAQAQAQAAAAAAAGSQKPVAQPAAAMSPSKIALYVVGSLGIMGLAYAALFRKK